VHKPLAKQLVKLLEPHRPLFVEEPLLPGHPNEMKDLYNKTSIPIAASVLYLSLGEMLTSPARRASVHPSRLSPIL
jgi:L-alanine-DL-glutamate epimerase-like enolase superfamily enzyme